MKNLLIVLAVTASITLFFVSKTVNADDKHYADTALHTLLTSFHGLRVNSYGNEK